MPPDPQQVRSFYQSAVLGLRALDARASKARRFGSGPDARWKLFAHHLTDSDRLDLLVRDAAVQHPLGFAPRAVFALPGLADDEPYGPEWKGADAASAHDWLRGDGATADGELAGVLRAVAEAWRLSPSPPDPGELEGIRPATRLALAGAGAVLAVVQFFEGRSGYDLADQVVLVTDHPGERQLFGIGGALLDVAGQLRALPTAGADLGRPDLVLVSSDAPPAAARALRELGG